MNTSLTPSTQNGYIDSYYGYMAHYSVIDAKNHLSRLIEESCSGERVVITKRGVPTVEIVPVGDNLDTLTGASLARWLNDNPLPERLGSSVSELNRQIQENRESWQ